ncbi:MAG TPA: carboxypeptidase-like regulatory domain-containing protein [Puia sp.]|jgi:hypothetical protein|nr:carboxypeptidase-like regulatory domain-containing protein [Puia sp.]
MGKLILLTSLVLIGIRLAARQPGNSLSGAVKDSAGGKPLAGVSVFLNNTSRGTVTRTDGTFLLSGIPKGAYQLVISAIGYETTVMEINGAHPPGFLNIILHQKATELAAVTVEPYDRNGWAKWGKFFREYFIGTGANAGSCKIMNKEVLRFHFYRRSNRLSVTAAEPLLIENKALGYLLEYRLQEFVCDYNTQIVGYFGYPFFREMTPKKEDQRRTWVINRKQAYYGSMMHFMRSLYAGRSISEGFLAQKREAVPNWERRRIKEIYHPDFQGPGVFPMDTLYHFWEVLKEPDPIPRNMLMPPDSLMTVDSAHHRRFYFDNQLTVIYGANDRSQNFYQSGIQLMSSSAVIVEENGYFYPAREILATGYWAQSEKISNLLPLDYGL